LSFLRGFKVMMNVDKVVAIDGPSGSGKSSIAKAIAKELGFLYVDTGAMYRALGYYLDHKHMILTPNQELFHALRDLKFGYGESESVQVRVDGVDLTQKIREHKVSELASLVSQIKEVRDYLTKIQRELVLKKICVMEGRDIGTVVFPHAFCKIFLTASAKVRALRRFNQLKDMHKQDIPFEKILEDIELRDQRDINREESPLIKAHDAELLDTSDLNFLEVIETVKRIIVKKAQSQNLSI